MTLVIERKGVFQDGAGKQTGTNVKPGVPDQVTTTRTTKPKSSQKSFKMSNYDKHWDQQILLDM